MSRKDKEQDGKIENPGRGWGESGNVFFTLFGAVALVGVVGVATSTLMRGPMGTVIALNQKAKVDAQLQIGRKLAGLASAGNSCDNDTFVEPLPPETCATGPSPTGGGCLPSTVGAAKQDPWGTNVGYCAWNHGPNTSTGGTCAGLLAGIDSQMEPVLAVISAGADRTFQTTCSGDPAYTSTPSGSDDIVLTWTYDEASQGLGSGLWRLKSGTTGTITPNEDVSDLDLSINTAFSSGMTAAFKDNSKLQIQSGSSVDLAAGGLFSLPDQIAMPDAQCTAPNTGILRRNTTDGQVLQICDPLNGGWLNVGGGGYVDAWGAEGDVQFNSGGKMYGESGLNFDKATDKLAVGGDVEAGGALISTGGLSVGGNGAVTGTLGVTGATTLSTLNATGAVDFDSSLNVDGTLGVTGATTLTTLGATGAVDFDSTLNVDGAATLNNTLDVRGNVSNGTGDVTVADNLHVTTGDVDFDQDLNVDGGASADSFEIGGLGSGEGMFSDGSGGLQFRTGGTGQVEIDSAGRLGVGTSPTATLDVDGIFRLRAQSEVVGGDCTAFSPGAITYDLVNDELLICSATEGDKWVTVGTSGGGGSGADGEWDVAVDYIYYQNSSFIVNEGAVTTGKPAMNGAGTRLLWYPDKHAFRAGGVDGAQWDDASIGDYSMALGQNVEASGANAFALGADAVTTGDNSMAIGLGTAAGAAPVVSGQNSLGVFLGDRSGQNMSVDNTFAVFGGELIVDPDGVVSADGMALKVIGDVGATQYCTENHSYCFSAQDFADGQLGDPADDREIFFNSAGALATSDSLVFTSAGNMGLGTAAPESMLHVGTGGYAQFEKTFAGAPTAADCDAAVETGRIVVDTTNDRWYVCTGAGGWKYAAMGASGGIAADSLDFTEFKDAMTLDASTDIAAAGTNVLSITNTGTGDSFLVNDQAADATPFVIDAAGNVGIGRTPGSQHALAIRRDSSAFEANIVFTNQDTGATSLSQYIQGEDSVLKNLVLTYINSTYTPFDILYAPNTASLRGQGTGGLVLAANDAAGIIKFATAGTAAANERMRITAAGNVGVGTNGPQSLFHVGTGGYAQFEKTFAGAPTGTDCDAAAELGRITVDTTNDRWYVCTGAGGWKYTNIGASGGIAADSLDFTEFKDAMTLDASTDIAATGTNVLSITNSGTGNSFVVNDQAADTTPFVIDASGNVGIGTTTPTALLDVTGGFLHTTYNTGPIAAIPASSALGGLTVGWNRSNGNAEVNFYNVYDNANTAFQFSQKTGAATYADLMTILGNGNVGIGTIAPVAKLDVMATNTGASASNPNYVTSVVGGAMDTNAASLVRSTVAPVGAGIPTETINSATAGWLDLPATNAHAVWSATGVHGVVTNASPDLGNGSGWGFNGVMGEYYNTGSGFNNNLGVAVQGWSEIDGGFTWHLVGGEFQSRQTGGTVSDHWGVYGSATSSGGATSYLYGVEAKARVSGGTVTESYGLLVGSVFTSGSLSKRYGIFLDTMSGTPASDNYALYVKATQPNYFAGNVGIGTLSAQSLLHVGTGGYAQFQKTFAGAPTGTDCDAAAELGRVTVDTTNNRWYVCTGAAGWKYADIGAAGGGVTADSLDFTEFKDAMTLDASTDIAATGTNVLSITNSGTGNSFLVNDQAADTTPFVIDASGKVGIGASGPVGPLDVRGGSTYLTNTTTAAGTFWAGASLRLQDDRALAQYDGAGITFEGKYTGAGAYSAYGMIRGFKEDATDGGFTGGLMLSTRSGDMIFKTQTSLGVIDDLTTGTSMVIKDTGNVGIGTTAPGAILNIKGTGPSSYSGIMVQNNFTDGTDKAALALIGARKTNANTPFSAFGTWDSGIVRDVYVGGGNWGVPDATEILFYTAPAYNETADQGVMRMSIASSGNVGIGAFPAQSLLHVGTGGYAQFQKSFAGAPTGTDCDAAAELGRVTIDTTNNRWYVCAGAAGWKYTSIGGTGSAALNDITAATANQTGIANGAYTIQWNWDTLAGGSALKLASTSTAAASNAQKMFEVALSGANATAGQSTYGIYSSNAHTGATSGNYGIYGSATGGTDFNYGVYGTTASTVNGSIGVYGIATGGTGDTSGVTGQTNSVTDGSSGVFGNASQASGATYGGYFSTQSVTDDATGVFGTANGATGATYGVSGRTNSTTAGAAAVYAFAAGASGATYAVLGLGHSSAGYGGYFTNDNGGYALATGSGNVGIGTSAPGSLLHVGTGGYAQFQKTFAGAPTGTDCDAAAELGRVTVDTTNNRWYVCTGAAGWKYADIGGSGGGDNLGNHTATTNIILGTNYISRTGGASKGLGFDASDNASFSGTVDMTNHNILNAVDVSVTTVSYDLVAGNPPQATGLSLDGLTDVTITSAANGECLVYNGTAWVDGACTGGSGDNLGNHTATTNVILGTNYISRTGTASKGLVFDASDNASFSGDIQYTGTLTDASDRRLKTDIVPLDSKDVLNRLAQVNTYTFHMKNNLKQLEYGVIAQEVEGLFPDLVRTDSSPDAYKSVNYVGFVAPLIEAAKVLKTENETLKAEIDTLKAERAEIHAALDAVRADVKGLKAHTGYGIGKAQAGIGMLAGAGGAAAIVFLANVLIRRRTRRA